jgi:glycosyltransferase involved in cell wall biosynthesis
VISFKDGLLETASFTPTSIHGPNAWYGHLPFAAWIIRTLEPKIFVELGTHTGNSYFSFCQSAKEKDIATKCYAVDTWQGEEHAGIYGEEVFQQVNTHNLAHYVGFSRLLRMTFDDALSYFSEGSIDLLHIDGFHSYEAVKHDFETWLPKLAVGAVVLFHDTAVRESGFGVWKFWEELQARYPNNFEFVHSNGLGVLQLDGATGAKKLAWLDPSNSDQQRLKNYFTSLGALQLEKLEYGQTLAERDRLIEYYHNSAVDRDSQVAGFQHTLADRDSQVAGFQHTLAERDSQVAGFQHTLADRDSQVAGFQHTLADRDSQVAGFQHTLAERDSQVAGFQHTLADRDSQVAGFQHTLADRDSQVAGFQHTLAERDSQVASLSYEIYDLRNSTSWQITAPIRFIRHQARRIRHLSRILPGILQRGGGLWATTRKGLVTFKSEGWAGVKGRFRMVYGQARHTPIVDESGQLVDGQDYTEWVRRYDTLDDAARGRIRNRINVMSYSPKISLIMPVYDPPIEFLDQAIWSVRNQLYPIWELCIADDASKNQAVRDLLKRHAHEDERIRLIFRAENGHISKASNSALELAQGDFIAMFDHDDLISEHALYMVAEELNRNPELDFVYSDQDKIDIHGLRYDPYFKPDFNPDLLRSQNFVDHLAVFRTALVRELGGWRTEFDGSQDYDLVLRVTERLSPSHIAHIPYVLYHWRAVPGSLAIDAGAKNYAANRSRQALAEHLKRLGIQAEVTSNFPNLSIHRVIYPLPEEPLVSVIIPTKDGIDILRQCMDGLFNKTDYKNFEVIIVDNQSTEPETFKYFDELSIDKRVKIINYDLPFNYSRINNIAVREAKGSVLVLLNNDIEVINSDWLREMVSHALRPEIGAVGARLYYPDGTVQHAGVLLGYKGKAGHMYRYASPHWLGYWARGVLIQNLTAVTAACMVLRREVYEEVGGFDEENFTVTFNDVDLCLRIYQKGYRNLYTPYAELYHHESKTRGLHAFQHEEDFFATKWKEYIKNDPAYNPNLSLEAEDFSLSFPPRVRLPWMQHEIESGASNSPLVSIITRTYDGRQEFLCEALTSIIRQTYRPIQIVVVEDGSDKARSTIEAIALPDGITIDYESLPKRGRSYAGNQGLQLAKGEVFGFLDDDDLLLPDHIDSLVKHLYGHQFAVGVYSSSWEVPTEIQNLFPLKYVEGKKRLFGRSEFSIATLWNYNYIAIQSLLFRKELFLQYGGLKEDLDCLEDWDLWLRFTAEKDFVFLDKTTSEFRMPKNETILENRRDQHMQFLPTLRNRQKALLEHYKNTPHNKRLRQAFDSINV